MTGIKPEDTLGAYMARLPKSPAPAPFDANAPGKALRDVLLSLVTPSTDPRDAIMQLGMMGLNVGGGVSKIAKSARLAAAKDLVQMIESTKGATLDIATGAPITKGFAVGGATKTKVLDKLTPQSLLAYIDNAPEGTHLGAWLDGGKWHLDHVNVLDNPEAAVRLGIQRGEDAVGDLATYAATGGERGTIRLLKHRTNADVGTHFDPKFMGSGMAGAEKARPGRPGAIHFYGMKGKVEDMFKGTGELYSYARDEDLLDLGSPEARAMMKKANGDADAFERMAIKKGYKGVAEATDPDVKTPYARTYKLFERSPALRKGEQPLALPEAFQEATGAAKAARGVRAAPSERVIPEDALNRLQTPDVPQVDLPHAKSRGDMPEAVAPLVSALRTKYTPLVEASIRENPQQLMWYLSDPFASRFAEAGGDPNFFLRAMGPTSAATNVKKNIELASLYHYLQANGQLDEAALRAGNLGLPTGYKHRMQSGVNKGLLDVLSIGAQDPKTAQKQARYVANLLGNWQPGTLDLQVGRVVGVPGLLKGKEGKLIPGVGYPAGEFISTSPTKAHYPWIERAMQQEAERVGIPTAAYQAAGWPGQDSRPFIVQLNDLLDQAARLRGVRPGQMFDLMAQGRGVLGPAAGVLR